MKLTQLRELNNLSKRQVAEAIGCPQGNYSRYENGDREPSIAMLMRMAEVFGVSVDYLIENEGEDVLVLSSFEKELVLASRATDSRARQDAIALLLAHRCE